jgi:hypothetical protein
MKNYLTIFVDRQKELSTARLFRVEFDVSKSDMN